MYKGVISVEVRDGYKLFLCFDNGEKKIFDVKPILSFKDAHNSQTIDNFLEKWTGLMEDIDPDESKFDYLKEKYS
ncbi:MAG: DUF2442 domain-containing protein [Desulfamplus sp.]|nr:DUF2442 domain-containing protein [Desulfamplus sp.]